MSDYYTRTGDDGLTGILGKERIAKFSPRIEAIGTLDELNAIFGLAKVSCASKNSKKIISSIQFNLYEIMSELAASPENAKIFRKTNNESIEKLENYINEISKIIDPPGKFITPGETYSGAMLDLARTVTRRAERRVAKLYSFGEISNPFLIKYLNRLSSLCFVLELLENQTQESD